MSSILQRHVIKLNKNWQAFECLPLEKALTFLFSLQNGEHPGFAMDYETVIDDSGELTLTYAQPTPIEDWINLPIRESDERIGIGINHETGEIRYMRVPLVVICARFDRLPIKRTQWSPHAVRERDGNICQITRRKLSLNEGSIGHDIAQSVCPQRKRDWTNTIWMDRQLNTLQGTKTFIEMGWKPIKKPVAPLTRVKVLTVKDATHPSQLPFLIG